MKQQHKQKRNFLFLLLGLCSCISQPEIRSIDEAVLRDKIAGGWAGKMIGVTYGAPTEFAAQGCTYEKPIHWTPADIIGAITQDDIYVQLTFMETMDQHGIDAPAKIYHENFAKAGYPLWHANIQSRKNYFDSIFPPQSGEPAYNLHADDIDFQIESDYIGFISPAMPRTAQLISDKIGRIMNYGDGLYGGIFVAALYAEAYFCNDVEQVVKAALKAIPAKSEYAQIISDVLLLHRHYPQDWRAAWQELEHKWGSTHICNAGTTTNIDAKLNGAYIVMGLLYGENDVDKTMEISTRCGQDSDCNPSNAVAVLGIMNGFSSFPQAYQEAILAMQDSLFINTSYSFNKTVNRTLHYAKENILANGGSQEGSTLHVVKQKPEKIPLEEAFPHTVFSYLSYYYEDAFSYQGSWHDDLEKAEKWSVDNRWSKTPGDEVTFTFQGTGAALVGSWVREGGMADVYVDGKYFRTIDTYFDYGGQQEYSMYLVHVLGLEEGEHELTLVVKQTENPNSRGNLIAIAHAIVFKEAPKAHENHLFSFQQ